MTRKATHTIELKDADYWHRFYLYQDQEFIDAASSLRQKMNKKYGGHISLSLDMGGLVTDDDKEQILSLQKKYGITNEGLIWFVEGNYKRTGFVKPHSPLLEIDEEYIKLVIFPDTKLRHVRDFWAWIEIAQKNLPGYKGKSKEPKYPSLIYAIHRERRKTKPTPFAEIARLFDAQKLEGIDYSSGILQRFNGEEELEKYYRLYEPKHPT